MLFPLDALGVHALVLHREVIAVLALAAGENDLLSRHWTTGSRSTFSVHRRRAMTVATSLVGSFQRSRQPVEGRSPPNRLPSHRACCARNNVESSSPLRNLRARDRD